jgi:hypothetical protein
MNPMEGDHVYATAVDCRVEKSPGPTSTQSLGAVKPRKNEGDKNKITGEMQWAQHGRRLSSLSIIPCRLEFVH